MNSLMNIVIIIILLFVSLTNACTKGQGCIGLCITGCASVSNCVAACTQGNGLTHPGCEAC